MLTPVFKGGKCHAMRLLFASHFFVAVMIKENSLFASCRSCPFFLVSGNVFASATDKIYLEVKYFAVLRLFPGRIIFMA